jgi:citrate lyase subunit beta/citryl-CoA lyase
MPDTVRPPRSLLFVPATSPDKVEKALASAADGVIVDLEDAVAVAEKTRARESAALLLKDRRPTQVYLRVNALATPFCFDDLAAAAAASLDGIVLPKAESASELATVDWVLRQWEAKLGKPAGSLAVLPILETARGIAAAAAIAQASARVRQLMFGAVDFALDLDVDAADETGAIAHARFAVTLASREAGLAAPIDSVFTGIRDLDGLRAASRRARAMGFGGKACIHPAQIATINEVFSPSETELARAREIVAAFEAAEAAGAAAVSVGGAMVDYPVVEKARRVLATARNH